MLIATKIYDCWAAELIFLSFDIGGAQMFLKVVFRAGVLHFGDFLLEFFPRESA